MRAVVCASDYVASEPVQWLASLGFKSNMHVLTRSAYVAPQCAHVALSLSCCTFQLASGWPCRNNPPSTQVLLLGLLSFLVFFMERKELATRLGEPRGPTSFTLSN